VKCGGCAGPAGTYSLVPPHGEGKSCQSPPSARCEHRGYGPPKSTTRLEPSFSHVRLCVDFMGYEAGAVNAAPLHRPKKPVASEQYNER
jgi:hypothetical protein